MEHTNYIQLSFSAKVLLTELLYQYRGKNNGDLCCAFSVLSERGWRSETTIKKACKELVAAGFIVRSGQGGRNRPNLYALTMVAVDECDGKLEIAATNAPSNDWKKPSAKTV